MADREKVIKGLECCLKDDCDNCPYYDPEVDYDCDYFGKCLRGNMYHDALALLKAQEPRVMTLEELAAAQKTPVWRETKRKHKDLYNGWMLAYDIQRGQGITGTRQGMTEPNGRVGWCKLEDYGETWRCWTARPTDEMRRETPWE